MNPTSTIDIINFIYHISALNAAYLGTSVIIIIFLGGAFYLFNLRPFEKNLTQQKESLIDLKSKLEEKIVTMTQFEEKLKIDEKRLISFENHIMDQALSNAWAAHYTAQSTRNFGGDILALRGYLVLTQSFKRGDIQMCLKQIKRVLDQDPGTLPVSVIKMKSWDPKIVSQIFSDIISSFNTIQGFEELKEEIRTEAIQKWFSSTERTLPFAQTKKS